MGHGWVEGCVRGVGGKVGGEGLGGDSGEGVVVFSCADVESDEVPPKEATEFGFKGGEGEGGAVVVEA